MKKTYRYSQNLGRMVEVDKSVRTDVNAPHIMEDIKPYRAVGPEYGKLITSRSQHREYLRKHNLIEVGNERKYFLGE